MTPRARDIEQIARQWFASHTVEGSGTWDVSEPPRSKLLILSIETKEGVRQFSVPRYRSELTFIRGLTYNEERQILGWLGHAFEQPAIPVPRMAMAMRKLRAAAEPVIGLAAAGLFILALIYWIMSYSVSDCEAVRQAMQRGERVSAKQLKGCIENR